MLTCPVWCQTYKDCTCGDWPRSACRLAGHFIIPGCKVAVRGHGKRQWLHLTVLIDIRKRHSGAYPSHKEQAIDLVWANVLHLEEELFITFWGAVHLRASAPTAVNTDGTSGRWMPRGALACRVLNTDLWGKTKNNSNHCQDCQWARIHHGHLQFFFTCWFSWPLDEDISGRRRSRQRRCRVGATAYKTSPTWLWNGQRQNIVWGKTGEKEFFYFFLHQTWLFPTV